MDDPGSREDAFCRCVADLCRSSAVFRARVAESVRLMTQVVESKRYLDDLKILKRCSDDQIGLDRAEIDVFKCPTL